MTRTMCSRTANVESGSPARTTFLVQKKSAFGASVERSGECDECAKKRKEGLQAKLAVGRSDDRFEQEADRVAEQVLGAPTPAKVGGAAPHIQRLTGQPAGEMAAPDSVETALAGSGRPLEPTVRQDLEARFGHDFSRVRVHADAPAARSADDVGARAYTVGERIVFAQGQYTPSTPAGKRLLGHELTHVVQQSGNLSVGLSRQSTPAPEPVEPNATQQGVIDAARRAAAIRTQVASFRANGIEGERWQREAVRLARIKFNWPNPNMDQIGEILSSMGSGLITVRVLVAASGDPECGTRAGYVRGLRPPIVLCPAFFDPATSDESRIRTMVHEMAHARRIGNASSTEQYFPVFDCDSPGEFESADSWSNYVHCLSGQTPDQPPTVTGRTGGGSTP